MSKVANLRERLRDFMSTDDMDADGNSEWGIGCTLLDELIQAVRDEEALLSNKLLKEALYQAELEAARANRAEDKIKWMSERIDQLNAALFTEEGIDE